MHILSHRGLWLEEGEQNTLAAFRRSFENGFGTETDVRDQNGVLVISHDPPVGQTLSFEEFVSTHNAIDPTLLLALNIKADGLQHQLLDILERFKVPSYFVFDMSIPDMVAYIERGIPTYSRQSEIEMNPARFEQAAGVWLDSFGETWYDEKTIRTLLASQKAVCVVSAELHRRPHLPHWVSIRHWQLAKASGLLLCTDHPIEAKQFFDL